MDIDRAHETDILLTAVEKEGRASRGTARGVSQ